MLVKLKQGSSEWLDLRKNKITASDAAVVLGVGFATPRKRWMEKKGLLEVKVTPSMRYGSEMEEEDRIAFCETHNLWMEPAVIVSDEYPWMMASLDGINPENDCIFETKRSNRQYHEMAKSGKIPEKYWPQIQHQLMCCKVDRAMFQSCYKDERIVLEVSQDKEFCENLLVLEKAFWKALEDNEPPELMDKDYFERNDEEFINLASELIEEKKKLDEAKKRYEAKKGKLITLSRGHSCIGGGVKVTHTLAKGHVNYKEIPELSSLDLDVYRGPTVEKWSVTLCK